MTSRPSGFTVTRAVVERIDGETALLVQGAHLLRLPTSLLPDGVSDGSWVELRVKELPLPESAEGDGARSAQTPPSPREGA